MVTERWSRGSKVLILDIRGRVVNSTRVPKTYSEDSETPECPWCHKDGRKFIGVKKDKVWTFSHCENEVCGKFWRTGY